MTTTPKKPKADPELETLKAAINAVDYFAKKAALDALDWDRRAPDPETLIEIGMISTRHYHPPRPDDVIITLRLPHGLVREITRWGKHNRPGLNLHELIADQLTTDYEWVYEIPNPKEPSL